MEVGDCEGEQGAPSLCRWGCGYPGECHSPGAPKRVVVGLRCSGADAARAPRGGAMVPALAREVLVVAAPPGAAVLLGAALAAHDRRRVAGGGQSLGRHGPLLRDRTPGCSRGLGHLPSFHSCNLASRAHWCLNEIPPLAAVDRSHWPPEAGCGGGSASAVPTLLDVYLSSRAGRATFR